MDPDPFEEIPAHQAAAVLLSGAEGGHLPGPLHHHRGAVGGEREAKEQPGRV